MALYALIEMACLLPTILPSSLAHDPLGLFLLISLLCIGLFLLIILSRFLIFR